MYSYRSGYFKELSDYEAALEGQIPRELDAMMLYWENICEENGQSLVWTSFLRPKGPRSSLHHPIHRRAIDFRIFHPERGLHPTHILAGVHDKVVLHDGDEYPLLDTMVDEFKQAFGNWLGTDMKEHSSLIIHGEGLNYHGHMQCKPLGTGGWV